MRRLNLFLVVGMLVTFLAHAVMGALQLSGANTNTLKPLAWVCVGMMAAHIVVSAVLTVQTLYACKKSGTGYFRNNLLFWAKRITGLTIVIPLVMHLMIFHSESGDAFRLQVFTSGRMISQILFAAAIALHVLINIRPLLIGFGVKEHRVFAGDLIFVLSVVLLLLSAAFAVYYWRWMSF